MKTPGVLVLAAASLVSTVVASGCLAYTVAYIHRLEQRLQVAEAAIQSRNPPLTDPAVTARIHDLDERLRQVETSRQIQLATSSDVAGLERRIQRVEQNITPHLEPLHPYLPAK
ncbi:MAG TPA: hypothetical protein VN873_17990 [Candidatus Angelobacter sp.]|nr:hypothetical protein [Candidatus Angelobacter sp.]